MINKNNKIQIYHFMLCSKTIIVIVHNAIFISEHLFPFELLFRWLSYESDNL